MIDLPNPEFHKIEPMSQYVFVECRATFKDVCEYFYMDLDDNAKIMVKLNPADIQDHEFIFKMRDGSCMVMKRRCRDCGSRTDVPGGDLPGANDADRQTGREWGYNDNGSAQRGYQGCDRETQIVWE